MGRSLVSGRSFATFLFLCFSKADKFLGGLFPDLTQFQWEASPRPDLPKEVVTAALAAAAWTAEAGRVVFFFLRLGGANVSEVLS